MAVHILSLQPNESPFLCAKIQYPSFQGRGNRAGPTFVDEYSHWVERAHHPEPGFRVFSDNSSGKSSIFIASRELNVCLRLQPEWSVTCLSDEGKSCPVSRGTPRSSRSFKSNPRIQLPERGNHEQTVVFHVFCSDDRDRLRRFTNRQCGWFRQLTERHPSFPEGPSQPGREHPARDYGFKPAE